MPASSRSPSQSATIALPPDRVGERVVVVDGVLAEQRPDLLGVVGAPGLAVQPGRHRPCVHGVLLDQLLAGRAYTEPMTNQPAPNRLIDEDRPYLLSTPTTRSTGTRGPEALGRPGPRTSRSCSRSATPHHWCHVVARESFEDAETAAQIGGLRLRQGRPRRPDLDGIYMDAVQAADRPRRLADDGVPDPEGGPSTPAPTTPSSTGRACPASAGCWPRWPTPGRAPRRRPPPGRPGRAGAGRPVRRPGRRRRRPAGRGPCARRSRDCGAPSTPPGAGSGGPSSPSR